MSTPPFPWRRVATACGIGTTAAVVALLLARAAFVQTFDWKLYDQHVRWNADPSRVSRKILIVNIDETSVRGMEPLVGRWPWPRLVHASLVRFLARAPARIVAYDVLFTDRDRRSGFDASGDVWTGEESDDEFARAVGEAGNVVTLADATLERRLRADATERRPPPSRAAATMGASSQPGFASFEDRPDIRWPFESLAGASVSIGHNLTVLDSDGPLRRVIPFVRHDAGLIPSLEVAAFLRAEQVEPAQIRLEGDDIQLGSRRLPLIREVLPQLDAGPQGRSVSGRRLLVDFPGPPVLADGRTTLYREFSFWDLFYSEQQLLEGQPPAVDPEVFRDAYVFVGVSAAGLHDVFVGPYGAQGKVSGAQLRAAVADQLLSNRFVRPMSRWVTAVSSLAVAVAAAAIWMSLTLRLAGPGFAALVAALVWTSFVVFTRGYWLSLAAPLLAVALAGAGGLTHQYFVEGREKRAVKRLFSRYLSKDVYEQVLLNPSLAELGGKRRDMSVLFSDIRGFTAVTESGVPEDLVAQLNEYFSRMVELVFAHKGTVDKFVGDMVMALFGAPLDDDAHADHAVQTALAMVRALEQLNEKWAKEGRPTLGIGIGINSGNMIAGNIGSEQIRSYTVIGDNVNLAARLESLNKDYNTSIIISEHTAARLRAPCDLRPLGDVVVKGKSVAVGIFEVREGAVRQRERA